MRVEIRVVRGQERITTHSGGCCGTAVTDARNGKQTDMDATTFPAAGHRRPRPWPRGFSLIELLVVIAIITVLLAILAPSLGRARLLIQRTQCLARQRAISVALSTYASAHLGIYPTHKSGTVWADAYGLRRDHPYTGATDRPPLGLGLLVSTGILPTSGLGEIIHCPSFDNLSSPVAPGHCMNVAHPWGYGGSGWNKYPNHRIIGGFNYRGTSYGWVHGEPPGMSKMGPDFVTLIDTPDLRMRGEKSLYNAHGGYNRTFADGSGSFFADPEYVVDSMVMAATIRQTVDGRGDIGSGQGSLDEEIFEYMATQR